MSEMAKSENDNGINGNGSDILASSDELSVNVSGTGEEIGTRLAQPRSTGVRHPGHVYFILVGDKVKIGYSARPLNRLRALQTSHPDKLHILATIPGSQKTEGRLHERFDRYKVRGEWFRFTPEIRGFINRFGHNRKKLTDAPVPAVPSRPKLPVLPEVTRLLKLRDHHGALSAIGRHCSGLAEALPAYRVATDRDQKNNLAQSIQRLTAGLASKLAAVAHSH
jgi:hypothetical protein